MRLLLVFHGSARGGAPLCILDLARGLRARGIAVTVCCQEGEEGSAALFGQAGFVTRFCRLPPFQQTTGAFWPLWDPRAWVRLARWVWEYPAARARLAALIAEVHPDIVYLNSATLAPYAATPHALGLPTVAHVREAVVDGTLGVRKRWLRSHLVRHTDAVIGISRDNLERLCLPPGKAKLVYDPVDFRVFDYRIDPLAARQELGIPPDAKVALFAGGSVAAIKGRDEFLRAMAIVQRFERRLVCLMPSFDPCAESHAGSTLSSRAASALGYRRWRQRRLNRLVSGIEGRVVATGFRYDIERFLAAADVACVLHTRPHCSLTVNQAGAMKRPVVAFRIGGVEELVQHEQTGLLVDVGDVRGLADATVRLLSGPALCRRLGEGAYEQARRLFDLDRAIDSIELVVRSVAARRPAGTTERRRLS